MKLLQTLFFVVFVVTHHVTPMTSIEIWHVLLMPPLTCTKFKTPSVSTTRAMGQSSISLDSNSLNPCVSLSTHLWLRHIFDWDMPGNSRAFAQIPGAWSRKLCLHSDLSRRYNEWLAWGVLKSFINFFLWYFNQTFIVGVVLGKIIHDVWHAMNIVVVTLSDLMSVPLFFHFIQVILQDFWETKP